MSISRSHVVTTSDTTGKVEKFRITTLKYLFQYVGVLLYSDHKFIIFALQSLHIPPLKTEEIPPGVQVPPGWESLISRTVKASEI